MSLILAVMGSEYAPTVLDRIMSLISGVIGNGSNFIFLYIINSLIYYNLFKKLGVKCSKGLIPIYRIAVLYKNLKVSPVYFVGPIVAFFTFFMSYLYIEIANKLHFALDDPLEIPGAIPVIMLISMGVFLIMSFIALIKKARQLTKAFDKTSGYTVCLVIFENIFMLILALSSDKFDVTKLEQ